MMGKMEILLIKVRHGGADRASRGEGGDVE